MNKVQYDLERYLAKDLTPDEMARVKSLIEDDEQVRGLYETLRLNTDTLKEELSFNELDNKIRVKSYDNRDVSTNKDWASQLAPVLGMILLIFGTSIYYIKNVRLPSQKREVIEVTRLKGLEAQLNVYKKTQFGSVLMGDSSPAKEGDVFQLEYVLSDSCHALIYSIDGSNSVTYHLSKERSKSVYLKKDKSLLPFSYQLDDAPEHETFYMLLNDKEFDLDSLISNGKSGAETKNLLNQNYKVLKLTLLKEARNEN